MVVYRVGREICNWNHSKMSGKIKTQLNVCLNSSFMRTCSIIMPENLKRQFALFILDAFFSTQLTLFKITLL